MGFKMGFTESGADMAERKRRQYKSGGISKRPDGRWVGRIEDGYTASGNRRRKSLYGATEAEVKAKILEAQRIKAEADASTALDTRKTVKAWSEEWLEITRLTLRPKPWATDRSAVRQWIIPTIGQKRLTQLTPGDMRRVQDAQRSAGRSSSTMHRTHSTLTSMLRAALIEGYRVPRNVLDVKAPSLATNDRAAMSVPETLAALHVASYLPHGSRWAGAFLHGWRQGECLGLTWPLIDLDLGTATIAWELQSVPYIDRARPELGFRLPDGLPFIHLVDSYHLLPPKTKKGFRTYELVPAMREALAQWREIAAPNPWDLVWPTAEGRPANEKHDREEWHAIQGTAGIGHPSGRYYHPHEIRHTTATELRLAGANEHETTTIMGHSSILTTRGYQHPDQHASRTVLQELATRFGIVSKVPAVVE